MQHSALPSLEQKLSGQMLRVIRRLSGWLYTATEQLVR